MEDIVASWRRVKISRQKKRDSHRKKAIVLSASQLKLPKPSRLAVLVRELEEKESATAQRVYRAGRE